MGTLSRCELNIRMVFEEPVEDAEGVAEHEEEIDNLISQSGPCEKLSQEDQRSRGHSHGTPHQWSGPCLIGADGNGPMIFADEGFPKPLMRNGPIPELAVNTALSFPRGDTGA